MTDHRQQFGLGRLNDFVDQQQLIDDIGLDEGEIAWRKDFLDFDEEDTANLEEFTELFEDHADEIAECFYDHLTDYEETQAVIDRSPKDFDQLKETQKAYLMTLTSGEYDETYFRDRARIGKLHELLDMPMKHYIGQYNVYYSLLLDLVTNRICDRLTSTIEAAVERNGDEPTSHLQPQQLAQHFSADVEEGIDELHSLLKLLNLDMQVAVDTYLQSRMNDLEVERDRFAALFENVPTPVVVVRIVDDGMRVEQVNAAFEELFGYTAGELADHDFERYLSPPGEEPRPIEDRGIVDNIQSGTESELSEAEVTLETQFGRREFIRVSAPVDRPHIDDLEYAFYIDITDQKQREERLQVLSRVFRHDLRNQLNVVKSSATILSDFIEEETSEEMIERIKRSSDELLATSEKIRRVEQLVAGEADKRPIDVTSLIDSVFDGVRESYPGCEFSMSVAGETWVSGTETLELALAEVIENGAEHNDARSPHVEVSVIESLDGQYVDIRVADNGPGIPPDEYEVLTGQRTRSQTDHTSGLGLWTVNWIVTRAGGSLQFSANSPRGSIVQIRLPQADAPE